MEETIWNGGFYELTMEFSKAIKLQHLVQTLKKAPYSSGFWQERTTYHEEPILLEANQVYGSLLIDDTQLPCLISIIEGEGQSNWLDISIPQGSFF